MSRCRIGQVAASLFSIVRKVLISASAIGGNAMEFLVRIT